MNDEVLENLYKQLGPKLVNQDHSQLLKTLLEWLSDGGGENVKKNIKKWIEEIKEAEQ